MHGGRALQPLPSHPCGEQDFPPTVPLILEAQFLNGSLSAHSVRSMNGIVHGTSLMRSSFGGGDGGGDGEGGVGFLVGSGVCWG